MGSRPIWSCGFLLAILSCGGAEGPAGGPALPTAPPVASFSQSPEGPAIFGLTSVTFQALPDAVGPATYSWSFGDGTTATGPITSHVYGVEGIFEVVLTATNAAGSSRATSRITTRSLTGTWRPDFLFGPCFTIRLTHAGSTVDAVAINGLPAIAAVESPRDIVLTIAGSSRQNCAPLQARRGTFDPAINSFTVPLGDFGQVDTWRRQ